MATESVFRGLGSGSRKIQEILATKKAQLEKVESDNNADNATASSSDSANVLDTKRQIVMIEELQKEAREKELKYREQSEELEKKQQEQEEMQKNHHEMVSEIFSQEEEKIRKMRDFCDQHGFDFTISKEGNVMVVDQQGQELKALSKSFEALSSQQQKSGQRQV